MSTFKKGAFIYTALNHHTEPKKDANKKESQQERKELTTGKERENKQNNKTTEAP
jgi:hypothetical protein